MFLRAGAIVDWIREKAQGELTEQGNVRQEPAPAALPDVPRPESSEVDHMTSGMLVGLIVVLVLVMSVGAGAAISVWRRNRRRKSGRDGKETGRGNDSEGGV